MLCVYYYAYVFNKIRDKNRTGSAYKCMGWGAERRGREGRGEKGKK
jgi:hypothetical protein